MCMPAQSKSKAAPEEGGGTASAQIPIDINESMWRKGPSTHGASKNRMRFKKLAEQQTTTCTLIVTCAVHTGQLTARRFAREIMHKSLTRLNTPSPSNQPAKATT